MNGQILNNIYDILSNDPNVQLESKDFESWKKHKKPKKAYLGTFISGGPGGSNPTYRKYYKGMLD